MMKGKGLAMNEHERNRISWEGQQMAKYQNVHGLIGNTPLVELKGFALPEGVQLYAKLEYKNPGAVSRIGLAWSF